MLQLERSVQYTANLNRIWSHYDEKFQWWDVGIDFYLNFNDSNKINDNERKNFQISSENSDRYEFNYAHNKELI